MTGRRGDRLERPPVVILAESATCTPRPRGPPLQSERLCLRDLVRLGCPRFPGLRGSLRPVARALRSAVRPL